MSDDANKDLRAAIAAAKDAEQAALGNTPLGVPGVTAATSIEKAATQQLGFDLEICPVPLPSRGLIYSTPGLANAEYLDIRAMTTREEDILTNVSMMKKGTALPAVIKNCLMDKRVDVDTLISGDRYALMIAVRITGYGSDYSPELLCRGCDTKQLFPINLQGFNIRELDLTKVQQEAPGRNAFVFVLPVTKKVVTWKFLTGKEEQSMAVEEQRRKAAGLPFESAITNKLKNSIISVDGNTDPRFIDKFCQFMPARDSLALRSLMDSSEPSIDMSAQVTCPSCGHQEVIGVPLDASFFWPRSI